MKLRIHNETHFSTRALRGIITAVYRQVVKEEGETLHRLFVRVNYARTWGQAHGSLGYGNMALFFRKSLDTVYNKDTKAWFRPKGFSQPSIERVANTVRHELMHNLGFHHTLRSARADRFFYDRPLPEALIAKLVAKWGTVLAVRLPVPPHRDHVAERAVTAQASLTRWLRKQKLATTKVRLYRRQVRYYERRQAKAAMHKANNDLPPLTS